MLAELRARDGSRSAPTFSICRGERNIMGSNQAGNSEVVAKLMEYVRSVQNPSGKLPELRFVFHPNAIGAYGTEDSQWQAVLVGSATNIIDYGRTIEEAGERLLDRLLHPENYEDEAD